MTAFFDELRNGDEQAILVVVSAYFLLMGLVSSVYQLRITLWPSVRGELVHSALDKFGRSFREDEQTYEANVVYHYDVEGKKFVGTRLSPWYVLVSANIRFLLRWQMKGITTFENDAVAVYYNPSNPQKSFLIKPGKLGLSATAIIVVASLVVLVSAV